MRKILLIGLLIAFSVIITSCQGSNNDAHSHDDVDDHSGSGVKRIWHLQGSGALQIGGYGDNFAYNGEKVNELDGNFEVVVDSDSNTGNVVAIIKNAKHQLSKEETLEGDIKLVMDDFHGMEPFMKGGVAEDLQLHGDSGQGPKVMPEIHAHLAGWGHVDIYVDDKLAYEELHGHFMYTERARSNKQIKNSKGDFYSPMLEDKTGFTDSTKDEFHIVAHTSDEDEGNFPPNSKWIHLNFQDVNLMKSPN